MNVSELRQRPQRCDVRGCDRAAVVLVLESFSLYCVGHSTHRVRRGLVRSEFDRLVSS